MLFDLDNLKNIFLLGLVNIFLNRTSEYILDRHLNFKLALIFYNSLIH